MDAASLKPDNGLCGACGRPRLDSPSLYFCGWACQERWQAGKGVALGESAHERGDARAAWSQWGWTRRQTAKVKDSNGDQQVQQ